MRICMLSSDFLPNVGGVTAHIVGLSKALARLGHSVDVVKPEVVWGWRPNVHEPLDGILVHRLRIPRIPKLTGRLYARLASRRLQRLAAQRRYDLLHWHTLWPDADLARCSGVGIRLFTNHSSHYLEWMRTDAGRKMARTVLSSAQRVIASSRELANATEEAGFPGDRVHHIPNGVNTDRFTPRGDGQIIRSRCHIPADAVVFICARRLENKNGVIFWAKAIPQILRSVRRPVHFLFVGDMRPGPDSERDQILAELRRLADPKPWTFVGAVPNADMPQYYAAADISVLPSLVESTSITSLESMACGLPLIGTRVGGIPEIIAEGETGLIVEPASSDVLSRAALALCGDDAGRAKMGMMARRIVEARFGWPAIARQTLGVYETAMTEGPTSVVCSGDA